MTTAKLTETVITKNTHEGHQSNHQGISYNEKQESYQPPHQDHDGMHMAPPTKNMSEKSVTAVITVTIRVCWPIIERGSGYHWSSTSLYSCFLAWYRNYWDWGVISNSQEIYTSYSFYHRLFSSMVATPLLLV